MFWSGCVYFVITIHWIEDRQFSRRANLECTLRSMFDHPQAAEYEFGCRARQHRETQIVALEVTQDATQRPNVQVGTRNLTDCNP